MPYHNGLDALADGNGGRGNSRSYRLTEMAAQRAVVVRIRVGRLPVGGVLRLAGWRMPIATARAMMAP
jgi:hypothetical protein